MSENECVTSHCVLQTSLMVSDSTWRVQHTKILQRSLYLSNSYDLSKDLVYLNLKKFVRPNTCFRIAKLNIASLQIPETFFEKHTACKKI